MNIREQLNIERSLLKFIEFMVKKSKLESILQKIDNNKNLSHI